MKLKIAVFCLSYLPILVTAQNGSTIPAAAYKIYPREFYTTFSDNLPIYNGRVFTGYPPNTIGNAFFLDKDKIWFNGSIVYDSILYDNMEFKYDVYTDQLIVRGKENIGFIVRSDKISGFSFDSSNFVLYDKAFKPTVPDGFYQIVEKGSLSLIVKRQKITVDNMEEQKVRKNFVLADKFYVLENNKYHLISSKRSLFKLIRTKKKPIKKYLKSQRLSFLNNREVFITTSVRLFNKS